MNERLESSLFYESGGSCSVPTNTGRTARDLVRIGGVFSKVLVLNFCMGHEVFLASLVFAAQSGWHVAKAVPRAFLYVFFCIFRFRFYHLGFSTPLPADSVCIVHVTYNGHSIISVCFFVQFFIIYFYLLGCNFFLDVCFLTKFACYTGIFFYVRVIMCYVIFNYCLFK